MPIEVDLFAVYDNIYYIKIFVTVALTQSQGRLEGLGKMLSKQGFSVVSNPLIEIKPLLNNKTLIHAQKLLACQWLFFSSSATVEAWQSLALPFCSISNNKRFPRLATVGNKTAQRIENLGGKVEIVGNPQSALGLAKSFIKRYPKASSVALPKGDLGLNTLQEVLESHGIVTKSLVIYRTLTKTWQIGEVDVVVLASPSAVEALPKHIAAKAILITLGKTTYQKVIERGWLGYCAKQPTSEAVLELLLSNVGIRKTNKFPLTASLNCDSWD